jgi:hypothetical protein
MKYMLKKLKDSFNFTAAAIPKVAVAYYKKAIGDVATNDEQQFRKEQCESCPLFNGQDCDKNKMLWEQGTDYELLSMTIIEKGGFILQKDSYGNVRKAFKNDRIYTRGCGCSQTGTGAKWKFSFTDTDLEKTDGTAPCPMNKWTKDKFQQWELTKK